MTESASVDLSEELKNVAGPRKRIRHRKKQLYENILKQMEFYFSDANLSKDRYLGELIKTDPYVPLEIFLKFNKIRSITQDVTDIAKAMKNSSFLELSEDRLKVKRTTSLLPYDAEARTVYVESIPVTASREWLERVFSEHGPVAYISMPKFKNSNRIKGYAFIEFSKPEDAHKCLNCFTKMGCKLPTSMPPEELSSIKMFSVDEPLADESVNKEEKEDYEPPKKKKKNKKVGKGIELRLDQEADGEKTVETPTDETKDITTPTESKAELESKDENSSQDENQDRDTSRKKKNRKRSVKERIRAKRNGGKCEVTKSALWGMQVLSKSEWKVLRNKYLNLQRKYMKELKANVHSKRHLYNAIPEPAKPAAELGTDENPTDVKGTKDIPALEKVPGVFVKEVLSSPCLDVRLTKRTVRTNVHALHVEAKEGQCDITIRFDTAQAAREYCENSSSCARVLSGVEEEEQWVRAEQSRANKRVRGKERLLKHHSLRELAAGAAVSPASPQPTHTHIRFDEE